MIPVTAQFEVNDGCTHHCSHCYKGIHEKKNNPSNREVAEIIAKSGVFDLTLTGGEPLLDKEFLYESMDIFSRENVRYGVNSNLYLFDVEDLIKFKDKGVKSVLVSILGSDKQTHEVMTGKIGSFDRTMQSLDLLVNSGIYLGVNMVVNSVNRSQVYFAGKMLIEKFGIKSFTATPEIPPYDKEDKIMLSREEHVDLLDDLLRIKEEFSIYTGSLHPLVPCMFNDDQREKYEFFLGSKSCTAGRGSVAFSREGNVRVCTQEWVSQGNILNESLEDILKRITTWSENKHVPKKCKPCDYFKSCRGGCRVASKSINGALNASEPYSRGPIKKKRSREEETVDFPSLKVTSIDVRYREEGQEEFIIYLSPNAYLQVKKLGLNVFRRYLEGRI